MSFAHELLRMRDRDLTTRERLLEEGVLYDGYHPEMERLHIENSRRLEEWMEHNGYPTVERVGAEASEAAWLIVQHAIGRPDFQRKVLDILRELSPDEVNPKHAAYLEDRIHMYEGKPQRYGTQFEWNDDGILTPAPHDDPAEVDRRRLELGLPPLEEATAKFRREQDYFPSREEVRIHRENYYKWLKECGWR